jgi:hypothetical protein
MKNNGVTTCRSSVSSALVLAVSSLALVGCGKDLDADAIPSQRGLTSQGISSGLLWAQPTTGRAAMWQMKGTTLIRDDQLASGPPGSLLAGGGDFDGDGNGDIFWRDPISGGVTIWKMAGNKVASIAVLNTGNPPLVALGTGDFDGDGKDDIVWLNGVDRTVSIWFMSSASAVRSAATVGTAAGTFSGLGDFDGDGKTDILWRVNGADVRIWVMNGATVTSATTPGSATADWAIRGTGRFDGDLISDIVWSNASSGDTSIWVMNGPSSVRSFTTPGQMPTDWLLAGAANMDGDGVTDLVWRRNTGAVKVWTMTDASTVKEVGRSFSAGTEWTMGGWVALPSLGAAFAFPPVFPDPPPVMQHKKLLVVLCKFFDQPVEPHDQSYYQRFFTETGAGQAGMYDYYKSISVGALDISGSTVTTWRTMSTTYDFEYNYAVTTRNRSGTVQHCLNAAPEYNPSLYDVAIAVFNYSDPMRPFDFGAAGNRVDLTPNEVNVGIAGQEISHALGLLQHSWGEGSTPGDEYGDPFDVMSCYNCYLFTGPNFVEGVEMNGPYRNLMWPLPSSRVGGAPAPGLHIPRTLAALNRPDAGGTYMITFPPYAFELRLVGGFDRAIPADTVLVHRLDTSTGKLITHLMGSGSDPKWVAGRTFTDPSGQTSVTVRAIAPVSGNAFLEVNRRVRSSIVLTGGSSNGSPWTTVPMAFSNGDGTFQVTNRTVADFPLFATQSGAKPVPGDFDGDGRGDVALTGGSSNGSAWGSIPVAFSNGDGSFRVTNGSVADFGTFATQSGAKPVSGDFDGDGRSDIALTGGSSNGTPWKSIPVAFSNGDGTFRVTNASAIEFALDATQGAAKPVSGDFDGDGKSDIALTGGSSNGVPWTSIPVAFSNGDGSFRITNVSVADFGGYATQGAAKPVSGDFDGDGKGDIALTGGSSNGVPWTSIPVAFSNGDGSFRVANASVSNFGGYATQGSAKPVAGDFDADGRGDIALTGGSSNGVPWTSIPVAFSNGDGSFRITNATVADFPTYATQPGAKPVAAF